MKYETELKQACLISVACRSVKYQLNEVKMRLQIYLKKDQRFWIWIAIDRNRNKIIDYEIGDRSKWTYFKLYTRIKNKYKVNYLCTDGYEAYSSFTLAQKKHTTTKTEIQSPSYASLLAITNLLLGKAQSQTMMCLHNHCSLSFGEVPK